MKSCKRHNKSIRNRFRFHRPECNHCKLQSWLEISLQSVSVACLCCAAVPYKIMDLCLVLTLATV